MPTTDTNRNTRDIRPPRPPSSGGGGQPQWWQYAQQYGQQKPKAVIPTYGRGRGTNANYGTSPGSNIPDTAFDATYYANQQRLEDANKRERESRLTGTFHGSGGTQVPTGAGAAYANYNPTSSQVIQTAPKPALPPVLPAWMSGLFNRNKNQNQWQYDRTPKPPAPLTGTFLGGGGNMAQGSQGQGVSTMIPTGSVLAANGTLAMGPNMQPYYIGTPGPSTFIGAGGEAVRGPDLPIYYQAPGQAGGGTGFGTQYGWGRGGRGGGGYGGGNYGGYNPEWAKYMNLFSWNYKG